MLTTTKNNEMPKGKIKRQSLYNRFIHWGTAISILVLIVSGLGQLPLYNRYYVTSIPGAEWLGEFFKTLDLHLYGAAMLIFVVTFHLVFHGMRKEFDIMPRRGDLKESYLIIKAMFTKGQEPPSDKYLAEQRLAYFFIGINVLLLIITGMIKVYKNLPGMTLPYELTFWATQIHNLATVLLIFGIVGHLAAFLIKENRHLLPGMFTGYVDEEYTKHRHSIWYAKLKGSKQNSSISPKKKTQQEVKQKHFSA